MRLLFPLRQPNRHDEPATLRELHRPLTRIPPRIRIGRRMTAPPRRSVKMTTMATTMKTTINNTRLKTMTLPQCTQRSPKDTWSKAFCVRRRRVRFIRHLWNDRIWHIRIGSGKSHWLSLILSICWWRLFWRWFMFGVRILQGYINSIYCWSRWISTTKKLFLIAAIADIIYNLDSLLYCYKHWNQYAWLVEMFCQQLFALGRRIYLDSPEHSKYMLVISKSSFMTFYFEMHLGFLAESLGFATTTNLVWYVLFTIFAPYSMLPLPLMWCAIGGILTGLLHTINFVISEHNNIVITDKVIHISFFSSCSFVI